VLQAEALHLIGDELGGPADIFLMLGQGADAGDAQQVLQFAEESLLVLLGVGNGRRGHESRVLLFKEVLQIAAGKDTFVLNEG
jgi:hypothetical protein